MMRRPATEIALFYALFGAVWIVATDWTVDFIFQGETAVLAAQAVKGLLYVGVTAAMVYWLARRAWSRTDREVDKVRRAQDRFRAVVEGAPEGIFMQSGGRFEYANPAFVRLLGARSPEEVLGRSVVEQFHEADRGAVAERIRTLAEEGRAVDLREETLLTLAGDPVTVEVAATPLQYEGTPSALVFVRDVRARKLHETTSERLRQAIEQSADAVVITDREGRIEYANRAFEAITGWSRDEALGRPLAALRDEGSEKEAFRETWQALHSEGAWQGRVTNRRADGTTCVCDVSMARIRDAQDEVAGYVEIQREVTRQLDLEAQLARAQRLESIGRLAGGVAHDFNNMLTVVSAHAELAMERVQVEEVRRELMGILDASRSSARLVEQLLAFARQQLVAPRVLDLNAAVERRLEMLRRLIGEHVNLRWRPSGSELRACLDPGQLDQLLTNLIVNSRDALGEGGQVTVETAEAEFDEEYCADHVGFVPGRYAMLAVSDTGSGMDSETVSRIFEPFYSTKDQEQGSGLGLATVYGIVRQNEGFVNVYSELGEGTTLRIYLPASREAVAAERDLVAPAAAVGGSETVLLVEDDPALLKLADRLLARLGYRVLTAGDPQEALALAEEWREGLDLVLTDVVLPGMNGRDLYAELTKVHPRLHCLFMSGYTADVIAHRKVLDEGVHFLQKPFTSQDLAVKVREALQG